MNVKPLSDRIIIKRLDATAISKFGIIIPDTSADKGDRGVVVAVGAGTKDKFGIRIPPSVQVNDTVLFNKHAGTIIKQDGEDLLVLKEEDILAVVESDNV
jgi:chaperonin GroES